MKLRGIIFIFPIALFLHGCSMRTLALRATAGLLDQGVGAFFEEEDLAFAETAMASQLKLLEVLLRNDSANPKLLLNASQGFGGYAFLFLNDRDPERAKIFYLRGKKYGLRLLDSRFQNSDLTALESSLKQFGKKDVPALFWTAYSWGNLVNVSRDDPNAISDLPKVESLMRRVRELDPEYFYGGAALFLASYYGSRPKIFGGDLAKSEKFFEEAEKVSQGKFLMGLVLRAQYHAVPAQDKAEFESLLKRVIESPKDDFPEQRLSNAAAKEKAKKLMEKINDLF